MHRAALCALAFAATLAWADAPVQPQVLIEAFGDSTTLGISCSDGHCGPRDDNAVTYLQEQLR
ncbi:MAG TPA: SGNH/GDSL hydrolase family protein, partial [Paraburkholderia sp.]|nr:SGNH/GDSL hydrolase family protein [Paraburkholderia sp.]